MCRFSIKTCYLYISSKSSPVLTECLFLDMELNQSKKSQSRNIFVISCFSLHIYIFLRTFKFLIGIYFLISWIFYISLRWAFTYIIIYYVNFFHVLNFNFAIPFFCFPCTRPERLLVYWYWSGDNWQICMCV